MKKLINVILITVIGFSLIGCGARIGSSDIMIVSSKSQSLKAGYFTYCIGVPASPDIIITTAESFEVGRPIYFTQEK